MTASDDLLTRIEGDAELAALLVWPADFDITRRNPVEELRLPTGIPLHPVAGDSAGGTYFLCGEPDGERPVLYAGSEGEATLVGATLWEVVELVATLPYWHDLPPGTTAADVAELEELMREDHPEFDEARRRLLTALGLVPAPPLDLVARLHAATARTSPDYLPIGLGKDTPYQELFAPRGDGSVSEGPESGVTG